MHFRDHDSVNTVNHFNETVVGDLDRLVNKIFFPFWRFISEGGDIMNKNGLIY